MRLSSLPYAVCLLLASLLSCNSGKDPRSSSPAESAPPLTPQKSTASTSDPYAPVLAGQTARARNDAQGLSWEARGDGLSLFSEQRGKPWSVTVRADHYGCVGRTTPLEQGSVALSGSRVEIRRPRTNMTEWFDNTPQGLEQGFTLDQAPACKGDVIIELEVGGDLHADLPRGVDGAVFRGADGKAALFYTGLAVKDGTGRALRSRMELNGRRLALRFDPAGARYPVTVDPLYVHQQTKLVASDGEATDAFGTSVAFGVVNGHPIAYVGAPGDDDKGTDAGAVYAFSIGEDLVWTQLTKLTAANGAAGDAFGTSIAASDNLLFVGAPGADTSTLITNNGRIYMYARSATAWTETRQHAPAPASNTRFGTVLATSAGHIIGLGQPSSGDVFIYDTPPDPVPRHFSAPGVSAAAINPVAAAVGMPNAVKTKVMTYVRPTSGTWAVDTGIIAMGDGFGTALSFMGQGLAIAALGGSMGEEQVTLWRLVNGSWVQQGLIDQNFATTSSSVTTIALAGADTTLVVGLAHETASALAFAGKIVVENPVPGSTTHYPAVANDPAASALMGTSAAVLGFRVLAGAPGDAAGKGAAYVFNTMFFAGESCGLAAQCESGYCVDGVCCDTACAGSCQACTAALKGQGFDGTCGPVAAGTDPNNECTDQGVASCGRNGFCSGGSGCQYYPSGSICLAASCASGTVQNNAHTCAGNHVCVETDTITCDTGYACYDNKCWTACELDAHCAPDRFCQNNACIPDQNNGSPCTAAGQCVSGFCVDNVCCENACTGLCKACSASKKGSGADGICAAIGAGADPDNECADDGAASCQKNGMCDGASQCQLYALNTVCVAPTCVDADTRNAPKLCNASHACVGGGTEECSPNQCLSGYCTTGCSIDGDCPSSSYCEAGGCVPDKVQGAACTRGEQCPSGYCVDGVCCDTACSAPCLSCKQPLNGKGADGVCGSIQAGTDPESECSQAGASTCGQNGLCSGLPAGGCQLYVNGVECTSVSCASPNSQNNPHVCDGAGNCIEQGTSACTSGNICSSSVGCQASCAGDNECQAAWYCKGSQCTADEPNGVPCANGAACVSGNCVDGVCCDTPCAGSCQACTEAKKGSGADGVCGPIAKGSDPENECTGEEASTCKKTGACDGAGSCEQWAAGTECVAATCLGSDTKVNARTCDGAGTCVDNGTQLCTSGFACVAGVCQGACTDDSGCAATFFCDGQACVADLDNAAVCTRNAQCQSGFCVDGFCCDTSCDTPCHACSAAVKGSGNDGVCGAVPENTDPKNTCEQDSAYPSSCKADGMCDASGNCRQYALSDVTCKDGTCAADIAQQFKCDGSGNCMASASTACKPYKCANAQTCASTCANSQDCADANYYCDNGQCLAKLDPGAKCTSASQCAQGYCVDGVCCNTVCNGPCEACNQGANAGTCVPIKGDPLAGHPACDGTGECKGTCNGVLGSNCTYPGSETSCAGAACTSGTATVMECNGKGACTAGQQTQCHPYVCDTVTCKKTCKADTDCVQGFLCDTAKGECVPSGARCIDNNTVAEDLNGVKTVCAPYYCQAGACRATCSSTSDCQPGFTCDTAAGQAKCAPVAAEGAAEDSGGCGCATPGGRGWRGAWLAAVLLLGFATRRRLRS